MEDSLSESDLKQAKRVTLQIIRKVDDLLSPLEHEMRIMQWAPEFQAIMWEAVMRGAKRRCEDANHRETSSASNPKNA